MHFNQSCMPPKAPWNSLKNQGKLSYVLLMLVGFPIAPVPEISAVYVFRIHFGSSLMFRSISSSCSDEDFLAEAAGSFNDLGRKG